MESWKLDFQPRWKDGGGWFGLIVRNMFLSFFFAWK